MSTALKWKLIAGFVLVFIAGGVTGVFLSATVARHCLFAPGHHGLAAERMRERLRAQLKLTPEQVAKISPIIDKAGTQLEQIRSETGRRVHQTFADAHREMSAYLTDEQRAKLEQIRQRHQHWMHRLHRQQPSPAESSSP
jgi:Spy/CpxP family protein refolding chaperone